MNFWKSATLSAALLCGATTAQAQSIANLNALKGLAPFSVLNNTAAGKAALASNLKITLAIQNGTSGLPALQPFAQQQEQALKDATITAGNGYELADGLGTKLGGIYQSLTSVAPGAAGKPPKTANITPNLATLFAYTSGLTGADSNAAKYFFADATQKTGATPAVPATPVETAIITQAGGATDVFGKAYNKPAGSAGADPSGDSRPFQVDPAFLKYSGQDFFGKPASNVDYLNGPAQALKNNPSFPSGHTTYGYTESLLFALMVPERYTQMLTRGAEYGNCRIVIGAHYAMDVIAGRTLAYYDISQLLAENPAYTGQKAGKAELISSFKKSLAAARADLRQALVGACGKPLKICATQDTSRFGNPAASQAFYESTLTYGLAAVYPDRPENVAAIAPDAGYLLTAAFPYLSLARADDILTETEAPGGGFLDNGSAFGVYSRLDLYKAAAKAIALAPRKTG